MNGANEENGAARVWLGQIVPPELIMNIASRLRTGERYCRCSYESFDEMTDAINLTRSTNSAAAVNNTSASVISPPREGKPIEEYTITRASVCTSATDSANKSGFLILLKLANKYAEAVPRKSPRITNVVAKNVP